MEGFVNNSLPFPSPEFFLLNYIESFLNLTNDNIHIFYWDILS